MGILIFHPWLVGSVDQRRDAERPAALLSRCAHLTVEDWCQNHCKARGQSRTAICRVTLWRSQAARTDALTFCKRRAFRASFVWRKNSRGDGGEDLVGDAPLALGLGRLRATERHQRGGLRRQPCAQRLLPSRGVLTAHTHRRAGDALRIRSAPMCSSVIRGARRSSDPKMMTGGLRRLTSLGF